MTFPHFLLALATVMIWGFTYVVVKWSLAGIPPILLAAVRFGLSAIPMVFFLPRPKVPWRLLAGFVGFQFVLQYSFLFLGMHLGMSAGLSSIVMQLQSFFTIGFAALLLGDRPRLMQSVGAPVALAGVALVALHLEARVTLLGFALIVGAGLAWSLGNIFTKLVGEVDAMALVAWGGLAASPCMLMLSLTLEGPSLVWFTLTHLTWRAAGTILFQAYPATLFCFTAWSGLMRRYPAATIAPFSLLVPVFGMLSSMVFLGEPLSWWKAAAAGMVIGGLALNQFGDLALDWMRNKAPS